MNKRGGKYDIFGSKQIEIMAMIFFASSDAGKLKVKLRFFSAKRWDRKNRVDLIKSATHCYDTPVEGPYRLLNPLRKTVLAAKLKDCTTAAQHLHSTNTSGFFRDNFDLNLDCFSSK